MENLHQQLSNCIGRYGSQPGNSQLEALQQRLYNILYSNAKVIIAVDGKKLMFKYEFGNGQLQIPLTDEEIELINKLWEGEDKLFV